MSSWPGSLPQTPLNAGYSRSFVDNTIRSQVGYGPDRVRRRTTAAIERVQMSFVFTESELATFRTFHVTTLQHGSLPFDWVDHISTTSPQAAAVYRFVDPPLVTAIEKQLYNVALSLEILP